MPLVRIDHVHTARTETVFTLDGFHQGCNQIISERGERPDLKNILLQLFVSGGGFEFTVDRELGNSRCTIHTLSRSFGARSATTPREDGPVASAPTCAPQSAEV